MRTHELKTAQIAWDAINAGEKTFEVRRNDRFFQRGDTVELICIDDKGYYVLEGHSPLSKRKTMRFRIGWMLQGGQYGIEPGYCVFSLERTDR